MPVIGKPGDLCRSVFGTWFLGVPMVQWLADMTIWEMLFTDPHKQLNRQPLKYIIELGQGWGAMSAYLLMQATQRGAGYIGVDHILPHFGSTPIGQLLKLNEHSLPGDLWSEQSSGKLRSIMADPNNHPLLLFCDNGDKPREFRTFAPWLHVGDAVAVHDFGNEFDDASIPAEMVPRIKRLFAAECDNMPGGVLTRWWEVVA